MEQDNRVAAMSINGFLIGLCFLLFLLLYTFLVINYGVKKGAEIASEQIYIAHYHASEGVAEGAFIPPSNIKLPKKVKK